MAPQIRKATEGDLDEILALFESTILHVNAKDYSPAQVSAWAGGIRRRERWRQKIGEQYFLLACFGKKLAGFASMTQTGFLDFLFVSKDHQREGIAMALYTELEAFARNQVCLAIETDASITARPFFEKLGFEILRQQEVFIGDVVLTNYKMRKALTTEQPAN